MLSRWLRTYSHVLRPFLLGIAKYGITPNLLTLGSLITIVISGFILAHRNWLLGGSLLLLGGILDGLDGALARVLNRETPLGGFLDSISDHCGDFAVSLGLLWAHWTNNLPGEAILIFLALFGSLLGSQVRSRAAMAGIETKTIGFFTRFERILVLVVGLLAGQLTAALWILAGLNNFSATQRIVHVLRASKSFLLILFLFFPLVFGACASLPKMEEIPQVDTGEPPLIVGSKGELPPEKSEAVMERLKRQAEGTSILERHITQMESISGSPLSGGNKATLLIDGSATYAAMREAIQKAKDHVNFETYIFEADETGQSFADLLLQKQAEGVQVNLIYDSVGCMNVPASFFEHLRQGGVQTLEFNPINPLKAPEKLLSTERDHRKILIVDGEIGFTGGVNVSDVYSEGSSGGYLGGKVREPWRDTHIQIEGPAVAELQKLFLDTWTRQKGPKLSPRNFFPPLKKQGKDLALLVGSTPGQESRITYLMYISAVSRAEKDIHLTNSYFVPDDELVEALRDAAKRGVDVKIVLPGSSDIGFVFYAGRSFYAKLLKSGVKLYERRGAILHAKTGVIDGIWATIGSTNLDLWSFLRNDEVNTIVLGQDFALEMEAMFANDLENSNQIHLEEWEKRPLKERLKEWFSRLFRYWL